MKKLLRIAIVALLSISLVITSLPTNAFALRPSAYGVRTSETTADNPGNTAEPELSDAEKEELQKKYELLLTWKLLTFFICVIAVFLATPLVIIYKSVDGATPAAVYDYTISSDVLVAVSGLIYAILWGKKINRLKRYYTDALGSLPFFKRCKEKPNSPLLRDERVKVITAIPLMGFLFFKFVAPHIFSSMVLINAGLVVFSIITIGSFIFAYKKAKIVREDETSIRRMERTLKLFNFARFILLAAYIAGSIISVLGLLGILDVSKKAMAANVSLLLVYIYNFVFLLPGRQVELLWLHPEKAKEIITSEPLPVGSRVARWAVERLRSELPIKPDHIADDLEAVPQTHPVIGRIGAGLPAAVSIGVPGLIMNIKIATCA